MPKWAITLFAVFAAAVLLGWPPSPIHASVSHLPTPRKPACCCTPGQCRMADCDGSKPFALRRSSCCTTCRDSVPASSTRTEQRITAPIDVLPCHTEYTVQSIGALQDLEIAGAPRSADPDPLEHPPCRC
jgi:hypothetical protein